MGNVVAGTGTNLSSNVKSLNYLNLPRNWRMSTQKCRVLRSFSQRLNLSKHLQTTIKNWFIGNGMFDSTPLSSWKTCSMTRPSRRCLSSTRYQLEKYSHFNRGAACSVLLSHHSVKSSSGGTYTICLSNTQIESTSLFKKNLKSWLVKWTGFLMHQKLEQYMKLATQQSTWSRRQNQSILWKLCRNS